MDKQNLRFKSVDYEAVMFDLDGVVTQTAGLHARCWKQTFDEFLRHRRHKTGESLQLFDIKKDYTKYVDGKLRYDGVRSFLQSRDIDLPFGDPGDPPAKETVCGLGNRKNFCFGESLKKE